MVGWGHLGSSNYCRTGKRKMMGWKRGRRDGRKKGRGREPQLQGQNLMEESSG
jgi:hypothetical protein